MTNITVNTIIATVNMKKAANAAGTTIAAKKMMKKGLIT